MRCTHCNAIIPEGWMRCPRCGKEVRCPIVGNDVVAGESARPICAIYKPTISVATIVVIG